MTEAELQELLHHCPTLYHMTAQGSWDSIRTTGLMSTSALLDRFGITGPQRDAIESQRRSDSVVLPGGAVIRDRKPMTDAALRRCLTGGMDPASWYRLLNGRVFFWPSRALLLRLLAARSYRGLEHDIIEVEAAPLVDAYRDAIGLCAINSGATFNLGPAPRGAATFLSIDRYDYAERRRTRRPDACVTELTVTGGVPDIARFVRRVVAMRGDTEQRVVYQIPVNNQSNARVMSSR